jgi:3'(2'), 5'-bisphosphate nucleotidase
VDPLDGTKEFISRNGEFTVNIALISAGAPRLGAVYAPVSATLFVGNARVGQAFRSRGGPGGAQGPREPIHIRAVPQGGLTAVVSRSHSTPATEAYLARYPVAERISIGSSLKFCLVAAGEADLYPRIGGPTMEWDTAAGHAVLAAAGGAVQGPGGVPLRYGKPGFRNPGSFIATGSLEPFAVHG